MIFFKRHPANFDIFISLFGLNVCSLITYFYQIVITEAYTGVLPITQVIEVGYWLICVLWIFLITIIFPKKISRPSDLFILVYLLGAVIWNATFWPITGLLSGYKALILLAILLFPVVVIKLLQSSFDRLFKFKHPYPQLKINLGIFRFIAFLLVLTVISSYKIAGQNGSFGNDYLRRLLGRAIFNDHLLIAYLFEMCTNGVAPFLAFLSGVRKSFFYLIVAIFFSIYVFWLLGIKSAILISVLMFYIGYLVRAELFKNLPKYLINIMMLFFILSFIEFYVNNHSLIVEYGFRRAAMVVAKIQAYFFDAMWSMDGLSFFWSGLDYKNLKSPGFLIGLNYSGSAETNANVNAYQHQIAMNGLFGYLLVVIGISIYVLFLDYLLAIKKNIYTYGLSFIFAFLLIEQSFTTALLSSAMFLCLLFTIILSSKTIMKKI